MSQDQAGGDNANMLIIPHCLPFYPVVDLLTHQTQLRLIRMPFSLGCDIIKAGHTGFLTNTRMIKSHEISENI